jgi:SAM-dependent methyltransferase
VTLVTPQFVSLFEKETGYSQADIEYRWEQFLGGINVRGKRVLDVGCGNGVHSFFLASFGGAQEVVGVDPSEGRGSPTDSHEVFQRRARKLGLENVRLIREDFLTIDDELGTFDVIVLISVLHHIHESAENAYKDTEIRQQIRTTFDKMFHLLNPGGWVIIQEASRYNVTQITRALGYRGPGYLAGMNWKHKQLPKAWTSIAREAGFNIVSQDYYVPFRFRHLRFFLNNPVLNYLSTSAYIIRAQKPG